MNDPRTQIAIRVEASLLDRVEAHLKRMREQLPGLKLSRADAIRSLLTQALDASERQH
tara:strand:- start:1145 stop:1318 length:174 start_codon:yes stop_codon:yes gene_type:complete